MVKEDYVKKVFLWIGFFFIIFLLSLSNTNAQTNSSFDASRGFNWLYSKMVDKNWDFPTDTLAFSVLALRNEGYDITKGINEIKDQESNDHWSSISGSGLATLALYKTKENVDNEVEWLLDQQFTALSNGRWLIQFLVSDSSGECKVSYDDDVFDFTINGTTVTSEDCFISDPNWVDFEECIKGGSASLNESLEISCFLGGVKPSILFRSFNNEYYIVDENRPFVIENGCFGNGAECSCTDTAFASWSLDLVGERGFTRPYLRSQCHESITELSFLYLLTGEGIDKLVDLQKQDGSFDGDEFQTAIAYLALKKGDGAAASKVLEWLKFKQNNDGSWDGDVLTTAVVLYSAFSQDLPATEPGRPVGTQCTNNSDCSSGQICKNSICIPISQEVCTISDECILDADCDLGEICTSSCVCEESVLPPGKCNSDSQCGIGEYCDLSVSTCKPTGQPPECRRDDECLSGETCNLTSGLCEKEEKKSWLIWLIVAVIVLVALIAAYVAYNQFFKGKFGKKSKPFEPLKPSYPVTRQRVPIKRAMPPQREEKSSVEVEFEKQLDESLKKARDLLKKK